MERKQILNTLAGLVAAGALVGSSTLAFAGPAAKNAKPGAATEKHGKDAHADEHKGASCNHGADHDEGVDEEGHDAHDAAHKDAKKAPAAPAKKK